MERRKATSSKAYQRPEKKRSVNTHPSYPTYQKTTAQEFKIRQRHNKRKRQKRLQALRRRTFLGITAAAVVTVIVLFLTPVFNIRSFDITGNQQVSTEEIQVLLEDIKGRNLFRTNADTIREKLNNLVYIDQVDVDRHYFPPSVSIHIIECEPYGYIDINGKYYMFDSKCRILEERDSTPSGIPEILGASDIIDNKNKINENSDRTQSMMTCLNALKDTGLLDKVDDLDMSDLSNIKFIYENRLNVTCGSDIDIERKFRLFKTAIANPSMPENARGTMDLSVTGNAMYTP